MKQKSVFIPVPVEESKNLLESIVFKYVNETSDEHDVILISEKGKPDYWALSIGVCKRIAEEYKDQCFQKKEGYFLTKEELKDLLEDVIDKTFNQVHYSHFHPEDFKAVESESWKNGVIEKVFSGQRIELIKTP